MIHIENFTGCNEKIIQQDFYSNIFMFNYLRAMKLDADQKVQEKYKNKKLKHEYKVNLNDLFGLIKLDMPIYYQTTPKKKRRYQTNIKYCTIEFSGKK